jgi:hypothetical protein
MENVAETVQFPFTNVHVETRWTLTPGAILDLKVAYHGGRKHLPIVHIAPAA